MMLDGPAQEAPMLAAIVNSSEYAIMAIGHDGRLVTFNPAAELLFGMSGQEILGKNVDEIVAPDETHGRRRLFAQIWRTKADCMLNDVRLDRDGMRKDFAVTMTRVKAADRTEVGLSVLVRDVTEQRAAEERFRLAVESSPSGMVMIGADGRIVLVNAQTEAMFGYGRLEMLGEPIELLIPERLRSLHRTYRDGFLRSPSARRMGTGRDLHGRRKDGSEFPVEIGLTPINIRDEILVLSAIVDITERKRLEQRFQSVFESSPVAKFMTDGAGNIVLVNAQAEQLFGYAREEILRRNWEVLVAERFQENLPRMFVGSLRNPGGRPSGPGQDLCCLRKDGREFPAAVSMNAIEAGEETFVVIVFVDMTDLKLAEREYRLLNEELENRVRERTRQLETANKDLEAFSYSVSHDLRAPLRAIRGFSDILQRRHAMSLNAQGQKYLGNIAEAGGRMERLVEDLLAYSRFGRKVVQLEPVPLAGVFQLVRQSLEPKIDRPDVTLSVAEDLPAVLGDATLLSQIFTNLLDNALTYRRVDVPLRVAVTWTRDNDSIDVCVRDNGIGIDPAFHEKIFDVFQRLHSNDEYPGTGIGLGIVKKCVGLLNATIRVESVPGEGSRFIVTLRSAAVGQPPLRPHSIHRKKASSENRPGGRPLPHQANDNRELKNQ